MTRKVISIHLIISTSSLYPVFPLQPYQPSSSVFTPPDQPLPTTSPSPPSHSHFHPPSKPHPTPASPQSTSSPAISALRLAHIEGMRDTDFDRVILYPLID